MQTYTHAERVAHRESDWSSAQNVCDEFKGMSVKQIRHILQPRRNQLQILFYNAIRDFNFSAMIRASNAFACESIVYSGFRKFNPKGAVGTVHYENIHYIDDPENFKLYIELCRADGYEFVVAESDTYDKSVLLSDFKWNERTLLMLGEESVGVDSEFIEMADRIVSIPQLGSVRSLNCASAGHILIYDYMQKTGKFNG